ncbi:MAG TPA: threonine/serine exporter family protein, partial [Opitutales bacterium]|nr:threonine/serine exporter family protein [Opitutales bacterium]
MTTAAPFSRRELNRMAKLLLKAARILMENGAESRRVFETVREMAKALELPESDILISHRSVTITVASGDESVTRIVRVGTLAVNMEKISGMSGVFRQMSQDGMSADALEKALDELSVQRPPYPHWLVFPMASLACGGFCIISGGDWKAFF